MRFSDAELALLDETDEIRIETNAADGGTHRTTIWVMVDGTDVFIRSEYGSTARWYRETVADPAVTIHVQGQALPATAIAATDPESVRRTNDAMSRKYATHSALGRMQQPEILDMTLRLTPR
jgi:hypothetical protein